MVVLDRSALGGADRDARRLQGVGVLLSRAAAAGHAGADRPELIHAVHVLTGFAFIDDFAGTDADPSQMAPQVVTFVKRVAKLD